MFIKKIEINEDLRKEIKGINNKLNYLLTEIKKHEDINDIDRKAIHEIRQYVRKAQFDLDKKEIGEKIKDIKRQQKKLEQELICLHGTQQSIEYRYYNFEEKF